MGLEGGIYLYHKMTPPPNLGHSWVIFEERSGGPKFCLQQSCFAMDLNKAAPPWRLKSWRKRYSNTMRL